MATERLTDRAIMLILRLHRQNWSKRKIAKRMDMPVKRIEEVIRTGR